MQSGIKRLRNPAPEADLVLRWLAARLLFADCTPRVKSWCPDGGLPALRIVGIR